LYPNGVDVDVGEVVVEPAALVHRQEQPTKTRAHAEPKAELPNVSEEKCSTGFHLGRDRRSYGAFRRIKRPNLPRP
jgi:hypothetical protein